MSSIPYNAAGMSSLGRILPHAAAFLTALGLFLTQVVGPAILAVALLLWVLIVAGAPTAALRAVLRVGPIPWMLPAFALASVLWSEHPMISLRAGVQLCLTLAMGLLCVQAVPTRSMIRILAVVAFGICVASLVHNNQHYDAFAGRVTAAGIYTNKNSLAAAGMLLALACTTLFFDRTTAPFLRFLAFGGAILAGMVTAMAYSVAILGLVLVGVAIIIGGSLAQFLPGRQRVAYFEIAVHIGALLAVGLGVVLLINAEDVLSLVGKDSTLTGRTLLWQWAERFGAERDALGYGFQAFWVQGQPLAEAMWRMMKIESRAGFHFHNLYHELRIQLGIGGVVLGGITILHAMWLGMAWARRGRSFAAMFFLASLTTTVLSQWQSYDLFQQFGPLYFLFALAVGYAVQEKAAGR